MSHVARRRLALGWLDLGPSLVARPGFERSRPGRVPSPVEGSDQTDVAVDADGLDLAEGGRQSEGVDRTGADERADDIDRVDDIDRADDVDRAGDAEGAWVRLRQQVEVCTNCALATTRRQTVFGAGERTASLMIIGEAPGAEEDARGEPFVGQAGRLLDLMLAEIGLGRGADVFICNVLKCRPPGNRNPLPEEVAACAGFLERQVRLVRPRAVLLLGSFAVRSILQTEASVGSQRGRVHRRTIAGVDLPIIVSYHPAYLLRNPADKRKSWEDLLRLSAALAEATAPTQREGQAKGQAAAQAAAD